MRNRRVVAYGLLVALALVLLAVAIVGDRVSGGATQEATTDSSPYLSWWRRLMPNATSNDAQAVAEQQQTPLGDDEVDVCGVGRRKLVAHMPPPDLFDHGRRAVLARLDKYSRSAVERDRVLALTFRSRVLGVQAYSEVAAAHTRSTGQECYVDARCTSAASAAEERASAADRQALIRSAQSTRDPTVYALAFLTCAGPYASRLIPECATVSAARWSQLDPANGAPWYYIAQDAAETKDRAARDEALHRIASAPYVDFGHGPILRLAGALEAEAKTDAQWLARFESTMGVWAALPLPNYSVFLQACGGRDEAQDANRRQLCHRVADALVERDPTLIGLMIGVTAGERSGWPPERVARFRDEKDAISVTYEKRAVSAKPLFSCAWVSEMRALARQQIELGELGAARAWMKESGRSASEWATERRQRVQAAKK